MKTALLTCIVITVILCYVATDAVTFQPFVRSRYSIRKRLTTATVPTENPDDKRIESSSSFSQYITPLDSNAEFYATTISAKDINTEQDDNSLMPKTELPDTSKITTTELLRAKSSTPSTDYDYYGNGENEDVEVNEKL